jgi:hypothetical protein
MQTFTETLENPGSVSQFAFTDFNAGFDNIHNVYANNLLIVPEPATLALLIAGAIGFAALHRDCQAVASAKAG